QLRPLGRRFTIKNVTMIFFSSLIPKLTEVCEAEEVDGVVDYKKEVA
ncbi:8164_t:CDS:1, partial [Entrophospora sp. SA101]